MLHLARLALRCLEDSGLFSLPAGSETALSNIKQQAPGGLRERWSGT